MAKSSKKIVKPTTVIQQTMFDIPAVQKDKEHYHSTKDKKVIREMQSFSELGLNAVVEGKSSVYSNFSEYIKSLNSY